MGYTKHISKTVNPTIGTDAYTAGDVVGGLLQFDVSALSVNGGLINTAQVVDDDGEEASLTLHLFEAAPATIADDAAFAPTAADLNKRVAKISFSTYETFTGVSISVAEDINNSFSTSNGVLYGYLVCVGTPTYTAATDLHIKLEIIGE